MSIFPRLRGVLNRVSQQFLYSWGTNASYATGLNTNIDNTLVPTQVGVYPKINNLTIQSSVPASINAVSFVIVSGSLYALGVNTAGYTGLNTNTGTTEVFTQVGTFTDWKSVSRSSNATLAIRSTGILYSWGLNTLGQTGLNTTVGSALVPTQVGELTDWKQVSGGNGYSAAIRSNGTMYTWGTNNTYRTGLNTNIGNTLVPTQVGTLTDWAQVSTGSAPSVGSVTMAGTASAGGGAAIRENGSLYTWGGSYGLGLNTGSTGFRAVPTQVGSDTWVKVSRGLNSVVAIRSDGALYTWGENSNGRTGLNTINLQARVPTQVGELTDWVDAQMGNGAAAIRSTGILYSWGSNASGQTGLNTTVGNTLVPTQVGTLTDWKRLAGGNYSFFAIR